MTTYHPGHVLDNGKEPGVDRNQQKNPLQTEVEHFEQQTADEQGFWTIPRWLFKKLKAAGFTLEEADAVEVIASLSQRETYCYASNAYLAQRIQWANGELTLDSAVRKVKRLIVKLEQSGIVKREDRKTPLGYGRVIVGLGGTNLSLRGDKPVLPPQDKLVPQLILKNKDLYIKEREGSSSETTLSEIEFEQRAGNSLKSQKLGGVKDLGPETLDEWYRRSCEILQDLVQRYPNSSPYRRYQWAIDGALKEFLPTIRELRSLKAQTEAQQAAQERRSRLAGAPPEDSEEQKKVRAEIDAARNRRRVA